MHYFFFILVTHFLLRGYAAGGLQHRPPPQTLSWSARHLRWLRHSHILNLTLISDHNLAALLTCQLCSRVVFIHVRRCEEWRRLPAYYSRKHHLAIRVAAVKNMCRHLFTSEEFIVLSVKYVNYQVHAMETIFLTLNMTGSYVISSFITKITPTSA